MTYITEQAFEDASKSLVIHPRVGTSARVAALSNTAADLIKKAAKVVHETRESKLLSPGQKAKAISKAHKSFDQQATACLNYLNTAAAQEQSDTDAAIAKQFGHSMSDEMAFLLVQSLRGQADANQIVKSDSRYLAALDKVPAAVAGLTPERVAEWKEAAVMSVPELAEMRRMNAANAATVEQIHSLGMACAGWMAAQVDEEGIAEFDRLSAGEV